MLNRYINSHLILEVCTYKKKQTNRKMQKFHWRNNQTKNFGIWKIFIKQIYLTSSQLKSRWFEPGQRSQACRMHTDSFQSVQYTSHNLQYRTDEEKYFNIRKTKYNRKIGLDFLKDFNVQWLKEYKLAISKQDFLGDEMSPWHYLHKLTKWSGKVQGFSKIKWERLFLDFAQLFYCSRVYVLLVGETTSL